MALNVIYEGDESATSLAPASRVRQIEARTVGANTLRTLRQANRSADFEVFEVDQDGDQLQGITGLPAVATDLGRRIRGTDHVRISRASRIEELGRLCRRLARYHERKDYQRRFRFVDNLRAETDSGRIALLEKATADSVQTQPERWEFAPPALIDFDEVSVFEVRELALTAVDLSIDDVVSSLPIGLSADELKNLTVRSVDSAGDLVDQWSLFECLDGQVTLEGDPLYVVDGGEFYRVEPDYLAELDRYLVENIPASTVALPPSERRLEADGSLVEVSEGDYNQLAADSDPSYLLLDKLTVTVEGRTSAIEICDVLTLDRRLIHVKRKFSSSSLSHLFSQGQVSGELLIDSRGFRVSVRERIGDDHDQFRELFLLDSLVAADFEIVYGVIGDWTDRGITDLPFFSKVNLRKHAKALRRTGYRVSHAPIPVLDP